MERAAGLVDGQPESNSYYYLYTIHNRTLWGCWEHQKCYMHTCMLITNYKVL